MFRFALAAAAMALMASPASASQGASETLLRSVDRILEEGGYNVSIETLTDQQVVDIYLAGTSSDGAAARQHRIETVLDQADGPAVILKRRARQGSGLVVSGEAPVVTSVQNFLDRAGIDIDARGLSDAQIAEIYFAAFGSADDTSARRNRVLHIIGQ